MPSVLHVISKHRHCERARGHHIQERWAQVILEVRDSTWPIPDAPSCPTRPVRSSFPGVVCKTAVLPVAFKLGSLSLLVAACNDVYTQGGNTPFPRTTTKKARQLRSKPASARRVWPYSCCCCSCCRSMLFSYERDCAAFCRCC